MEMADMANVLVTGGLGLIGREVVKILYLRGDRVLILDNRSRGRGVPLDLPRVEVLEADLGRRAPTGSWMTFSDGAEVNRVIHLAAQVCGVKKASEVEADLMTANMLIDSNVLEAAASCGVEKLVYMSTACVYPVGRQLEPDSPALREEWAWPAGPENGYGMAKLCGERLVEAYQRIGCPFVVVRGFNIYGPGEDYGEGSHVIPELFRKFLTARVNGGPVEVYGDGLQTRAFTYHSYAAEAIVLAMDLLWPGKSPVNISGEEAVSIRTLVELVAGLTGAHWVPVHYDHGPQGVRGRRGDITRAREILGWRPRTPLETGLSRVMAWMSRDISIPEIAEAV